MPCLYVIVFEVAFVCFHKQRHGDLSAIRKSPEGMVSLRKTLLHNTKSHIQFFFNEFIVCLILRCHLHNIFFVRVNFADRTAALIERVIDVEIV